MLEILSDKSVSGFPAVASALQLDALLSFHGFDIDSFGLRLALVALGTMVLASAMTQVLHITMVTQCAILEGFEIFLVLANKVGVKVQVFLTDMKDFAEMNAEYEKWFTSKPARSCVAVHQLPKGVNVEIECIAVPRT